VEPSDFPDHNAIRYMRIRSEERPWANNFIPLDWRSDRTLSGELFPFGRLGAKGQLGDSNNNIVKIIIKS
jgi:hypothetical protein